MARRDVKQVVRRFPFGTWVRYDVLLKPAREEGRRFIRAVPLPEPRKGRICGLRQLRVGRTGVDETADGEIRTVFFPEASVVAAVVKRGWFNREDLVPLENLRWVPPHETVEFPLQAGEWKGGNE